MGHEQKPSTNVKGQGTQWSRQMSQADSSTSEIALAEEEEDNAKWTAGSAEGYLVGLEESCAPQRAGKNQPLDARCSNKETQAHSLGTP